MSRKRTLKVLALTTPDLLLRRIVTDKWAHAQNRGLSVSRGKTFSLCGNGEGRDWDFFNEPEVLFGYKGIILTRLSDSAQITNETTESQFSKELLLLKKLHDSQNYDGIAIDLGDKPVGTRVKDIISKLDGVEIAFCNVHSEDRDYFKKAGLGCSQDRGIAVHSLTVQGSDIVSDAFIPRYLKITSMPFRYPGIDFIDFKGDFDQTTAFDDCIKRLGEDIDAIKKNKRRLLLVLTIKSGYVSLSVRNVLSRLNSEVSKFGGDLEIVYPGQRINLQTMSQEGLSICRSKQEAVQKLRALRGCPWVKPPLQGWGFFTKPEYQSTSGVFHVKLQDTESTSDFDLMDVAYFMNDVGALQAQGGIKLLLDLKGGLVSSNFMIYLYDHLHTALERSSGMLVVLDTNDKNIDKTKDLNVCTDIESANRKFEYHISPPKGTWKKLQRPILIDDKAGIILLRFDSNIQSVPNSVPLWTGVLEELQPVWESKVRGVLFDLMSIHPNSGSMFCMEKLQKELGERQLVIVTANEKARGFIETYMINRGLGFSVHKNQTEALLELTEGIKPFGEGFKILTLERKEGYPKVLIASFTDPAYAIGLFSDSSVSRYRFETETEALVSKPLRLILVIPSSILTVNRNMLALLENFHYEMQRRGGKLAMVYQDSQILKQFGFMKANTYSYLDYAINDLSR